MTNFGKYAVIMPVPHKFEKEPGWSWEIKPPNSQDELTLSRHLQAGSTAIINDEKVNVPLTTLETAFREVALTFSSSNIPDPEDDKKLMLQKGASIEEIEIALKKMPLEMFLEIWSAVGEACPGWGPRKPVAAVKDIKTKHEDKAKN